LQDDDDDTIGTCAMPQQLGGDLPQKNEEERERERVRESGWRECLHLALLYFNYLAL